MTEQNPPDSYWTLDQEGHAETKIQRSKFIATAMHASSEEDAQECLAELARKYHDSRHVCYAWRLGCTPATTENRNDDGEPSGTAGEPILAAIRRTGWVDVVVAVVRYFGGVKLGTGGLQRAYGSAADKALAAATGKEILQGRTFALEIPYPFQKTARHYLESQRGRVLGEEYSDKVTWKIWLPHSTWAQYASSLKEASGGSVELEECPEES